MKCYKILNFVFLCKGAFSYEKSHNFCSLGLKPENDLHVLFILNIMLKNSLRIS